MKKIVATFWLFCIISYSNGQIRGEYHHEPFPVYSVGQKVGIAVSIKTFIYKDFFGKDVLRQATNNPHEEPEYLIEAMFKAIQNKDLLLLKSLFLDTVKLNSTDINKMYDGLSLYTDVQFYSKIQSGEFVMMNYDFYTRGNLRPYFSPIIKDRGKYYLTLKIDGSNPFFMASSWVTDWLTNRTKSPLQLNNYTAVHFNCMQKNIDYSFNEKNNDAVTFYFDINLKKEKSNESDFLNRLHQLCMKPGYDNIRGILIPEQIKFITDTTNFISFSYDRIYGMLKYTPIVELLGIVNLSEKKKIAFIALKSEGGLRKTSSIMLQIINGNYYVDLEENDKALLSIFQNTYVDKALTTYFTKQ